MSDNALMHRVRRGRYDQVAPGVYRVVGAPSTHLKEMAATVASFPELAALSHQTAAELWGLTSRGIKVVEVVTTRWDRWLR